MEEKEKEEVDVEDLRKKKVVKARLLEGGDTAAEEEEEEEKEDSSDRFCAFVEGGKCTTASLYGERRRDERGEQTTFVQVSERFSSIERGRGRGNEEKTEEERRVSMKAYARKRCCKSCYNALYRSMRKELQMGSNKETIGGSVEEEMSLDNPR